MSGLRETAERIVGMGRFPAPRHDRRLAIEKAAARLGDRPGGKLQDAEPWDDFLRRIGVIA
jgi:hypothetical protein